MRKLVLVLTFSFGLSTVGLSQHTDHNQKRDAREKPATQVSGMGSHHHQSLLEVKQKIPAEAMMNLNNARVVLGLAEKFLRAKIAEARKQNTIAIGFLEAAAKIEHGLAYDEPPAWYIPSLEVLGGLLLRNGQWADAERAFRADLERNKLNGRSLFGLIEALKAQKKYREATLARHQFKVAWKNADTKLSIDDL